MMGAGGLGFVTEAGAISNCAESNKEEPVMQIWGADTAEGPSAKSLRQHRASGAGRTRGRSLWLRFIEGGE